MQWGRDDAPSNGSSSTRSFPIAFPTRAVNITASTQTRHRSAEYDANVGAEIRSRSSYRVYSNDTGKRVDWLAIGY
jgi:hypothetical protein